MNDSLFDLVIIVGLGVIPLFADAFKDYFANGIIRILARFAAPTISAAAITYVILYHNLLLSPFGITFDDNYTNQEYVTILITLSFFVLLWFLFFKLVSFGEYIGRQEDTGLKIDGNQITKQVNHIITPTLDEFAEKIQDNAKEKLESFTVKLTDTIIPEINKIAENQQNIRDDISQFNINEEQRGTHQGIQDKKIIQLIDNQQKQNDILNTVEKWIAQNPNTYEILLSRIEAINTRHKLLNEISDSDNIRNTNNNNSDGDSNTKTLLTTQDGIANRTIGHKKQQEMAQYLRDVGFEIIDGHGAGQPDFIIKKKKILGYDFDGIGGREGKSTMEIVAIGSNKSSH